MVLAEQEQEVGQLWVGQRMALGGQDGTQFVAGGQQMAQAANVVAPVGEGPGSGPTWRRHPPNREVAASLAQLTQHVGQQLRGPGKRPANPAPELAPGDVGGVTAKRGCQRRQRAPLDDKAPHQGHDLSKARWLVGYMRAGTHAWKATTHRGQLLDDKRVGRIPGGTVARTVSLKRPQQTNDGRADQPNPTWMILGS
jgi:hypothetical protein